MSVVHSQLALLLSVLSYHSGSLRSSPLLRKQLFSPGFSWSYDLVALQWDSTFKPQAEPDLCSPSRAESTFPLIWITAAASWPASLPPLLPLLQSILKQQPGWSRSQNRPFFCSELGRAFHLIQSESQAVQ